MPIELTQPIVQPAREYSYLWVTDTSVRSNPGGVTSGGYVVRPFLIEQDGSISVSPKEIARNIPDLYALALSRLAAGKPQMAQWFELGQTVIAELEAEVAAGANPFVVPATPPEE